MNTSLWIGGAILVFIHMITYLLMIQYILGVIVCLVSNVVYIFFVDGFSFWHFFAVYYFSCVVRIFVISAIHTTISIKTLYQLINQPDYPLPSEDIYQNCVLFPFEERAEVLRKDGFVEKHDQLYSTTPTGCVNIQRLLWIKKLLGVETLGFYSNINR